LITYNFAIQARTGSEEGVVIRQIEHDSTQVNLEGTAHSQVSHIHTLLKKKAKADLVLFNCVVALKLIPPSSLSLGSYLDGQQNRLSFKTLTSTHLKFHQLHVPIKRVHPIQRDILLEMDPRRHRELERVHPQVLRRQMPREVRLRDHRLRKRPKRIFVRNLERRGLVDRSAFVLGLERCEVDRAEGYFGAVDLPGDLMPVNNM
jgi:hypothetical protein